MTTVRVSMIVTEYYDLTYEEFKEACDEKFDEKTLKKVWKKMTMRKTPVVLGKAVGQLSRADPLYYEIQEFVSLKAAPSRSPSTSQQEPPHKS